MDSSTQKIEDTVLNLIEKMEGDQGIPWDKIVEEGIKEKLDKETIEKALESLLDKGLIYEPQLGRLKSA